MREHRVRTDGDGEGRELEVGVEETISDAGRLGGGGGGEEARAEEGGQEGEGRRAHAAVR